MHKRPDPAEFVEAILPSLQRAAALVRELEGQVANRPKTGERTDVKAACTEADIASQETLLEVLCERFPDVSLLAEEDTPRVSRFRGGSGASVVIDPIDGTLRSYLEGAGPYAVMIGLAVADEYQAALVALPREGILFHGVRGRAPEWSEDGAAARRASLRADGNRVFVSHGLPEASLAVLRAHGFEPEPACGGAVSVAPLVPGVRAGLRIATRESQGVSIRGRIGAMMSAEAGATLVDERGNPFPRGIREPARALGVAAEPADVPPLLEAVAAAGIR